ncbi:MAG: hypothetical protein LWX83_13885 [Anaerolineae bacterium]|nr:hypothetical protein [Anaerolineae bacterium]
MNKRLNITVISLAAVTLVLIVGGLVYFFGFLISARGDVDIPLKITPVTFLSEKSFIPGLNTDKTLAYLSNNNLACLDKEERYKGVYYHYACEQVTPDYSMTVHVFSSDRKNINLIDTNFAQSNKPSDEQTLNFLEIITRLPIDGVKADELEAWIKSSLPELDQHPGKIIETRIDTLYVRIYGPSNDRSLEIGRIN